MPARLFDKKLFSQFPWLFLILAVFLCPQHGVKATVPTTPDEQCQVILRYEGLCGNSRPMACLDRPDTHYYDNLEHKRIWDDYSALCVVGHSPGNAYSHECIANLGIGSTCHSTVADLVEYTAVTRTYSLAPLAPQNNVTAVPRTVSVTTCMLLSESYQVIQNYQAACGNVAASSCHSTTAPMADYQRICDTKTPCECLAASGCNADFCVTGTTSTSGTGSSGTPPSDGSGAPTPTGGGSGTTPAGASGATGTGPATSSTDGSNPVQTTAGNDSAASAPTGANSEPVPNGRDAVKAGGSCSLQSTDLDTTSHAWIFLGLAGLIPTLGRRGLLFRKSS